MAIAVMLRIQCNFVSRIILTPINRCVWTNKPHICDDLHQQQPFYGKTVKCLFKLTKCRSHVLEYAFLVNVAFSISLVIAVYSILIKNYQRKWVQTLNSTDGLLSTSGKFWKFLLAFSKVLWIQISLYMDIC